MKPQETPHLAGYLYFLIFFWHPVTPAEGTSLRRAALPLGTEESELLLRIDMTIAKKEWDAIEGKIANAIDHVTTDLSTKAVQALRIEIDKFRPHGWRRLLLLLREWGILATNITLIVALLGLAASQFYYANARIEKQTKFEEDTSITLKEVNNRLQKIEEHDAQTSEYIKSSIRKGLHQISTLPQPQFDKNLGEVEAQLRTSIRQQAFPDNATLQTLSTKLDDSPKQLPSYWPAFGVLVSLDSIVVNKDISLSARVQSLPDCQMPQSPPGKGFEGMHFHNPGTCAFVLDNWIYVDSNFSDVVVRYRGGPLILKNVHFTNCIFDIELPSTPADEGKNFVREVAANADQKQWTISDAGKTKPT